MHGRMAAAAGAVLAASFLAGCQQSRAWSPRRAPEFSITAARGIDPSVKLSDFRGKWLLIDFWANW